MIKPIRISFGADSPPIEEQLREQGQKLDMDPLHRHQLQCDADEVARLRGRFILTEAGYDKARKRIIRIIKRWARPL